MCFINQGYENALNRDMEVVCMQVVGLRMTQAVLRSVPAFVESHVESTITAAIA